MGHPNQSKTNQRPEPDLALSEIRARLEGIIESAMDAIISIDESQRVVLFNQAAEKTFGYSAEEMIGEPLGRLLPEKYRERHREHIRRFGETGTTNRTMGNLGKLYGLRSNGQEFPIEASISQIQTEKGKLYTVILRDITERVQAEEKLQSKNEEVRAMTQQLWQAAKLATMGELAASVAHELNNPLAILSLRIESVKASLPEDDPLQAELSVMEQEVDRMAVLVSNLLQFSRPGERQISTIYVRDEIDGTLELVQNYLVNRHIVVKRVYEHEQIMIQADRQQLRQLFLNLFTNAADAMPGGGTLTIRVHPLEDGKFVGIDVEDTGVGIPPALLPKITEPFFSTKGEGKGTGLGLSICRRIVEEHSGTMRIYSEGENQGARITVRLPRMNGSVPILLEE